MKMLKTWSLGKHFRVSSAKSKSVGDGHQTTTSHQREDLIQAPPKESRLEAQPSISPGK